MSETQETQTETTQEASGSTGLGLTSLYAFKAGMSSYIDDKGDMHAVTLLKLEPTVVSQIKTTEKDGYEAVQLAFLPKKAKRTGKAEAAHLKPAGFEAGAKRIKEIRGVDIAQASVGAQISLDGLVAGDKIQVTGRSKGKGFQGAIKRWGSARGPMTHGSGFHRRPGSAGNRTWPGRIMPGKKFPGHLGDENVAVTSKVLEVLKEENILIVKGAIPGARNQVVKVTKV